MTLTANDYREIASMLEEGNNSIEYNKDGEILFLDCTIEEEGYKEDDYYNGTGAWVCTERTVSVEVSDSYTEDGEQTKNDFDQWELSKAMAA